MRQAKPGGGGNRPQTSDLLRQLMALAIPVAFQSMLGFAVNLLDTVMLGSLGEVQISASSLSNQLFFVLSLLVYGIVGGSNVLVAQFWGTKDTESINKVLAYTYRIALAAALITAVAGMAFPARILSIFSTDPMVIGEGSGYLRIVAASYLFYTVTTVTTGALRSVRNVRISVALSAVSLGTNALLNWVLIFGKLGAPRLGILGAAIATTAARIIEFILLLRYLAVKEDQLRLSLKKLIHLDTGLAKRYFSNTVPVILNELFWSVGSSVLAVIMGRMGTQFVAANSIFSVTSQIAGVLAQGLCSAAAVMVGNTIGAGESDNLLILTRQLQRVGLAAGFCTALVIVLLRPFMLSLYNVSDLTMGYANQIMWAGAVVQVFKTAQSMNMMGILRGGGDAKFVMVNDVVFLWSLAVPLGFMAGLVWKLPVPIVYCILNIEQFIKFFTSMGRLRGNKWFKNVTTA